MSITYGKSWFRAKQGITEVWDEKRATERPSWALIMNLAEAKNAIRDDTIGEVGWAFAAAVIETETREVDTLAPATMADFLVCLGRRSLATSTATCALYERTKRPWPVDTKDNSRDPKEWEQYLKEQGFLP